LGVYPRVEDEDIWAYISHLVVNSDSVVEFHGVDGYLPTVDLNIGKIDIALDSILVIKLNSATGVFAFHAGQSNQVQTMRHIAVEVNGELKQSRWVERNGWYYLNHIEFDPWVPLPEASTYGAGFSFSALAVGFIRKRKKRKSLSASLTPSVTPM